MRLHVLDRWSCPQCGHVIRHGMPDMIQLVVAECERLGRALNEIMEVIKRYEGGDDTVGAATHITGPGDLRDWGAP